MAPETTVKHLNNARIGVNLLPAVSRGARVIDGSCARESTLRALATFQRHTRCGAKGGDKGRVYMELRILITRCRIRYPERLVHSNVAARRANSRFSDDISLFFFRTLYSREYLVLKSRKEEGKKIEVRCVS